MSRYISVDDMRGIFCQSKSLTQAWNGFDMAPSIDIVRCQDCKYWVYHFNGCSRNPRTEPWYATDFCNYGERREP